MVEIIPAILEAESEGIDKKIALVEQFAERVQLDVMDGKFVPNTTFNAPAELPFIEGGVHIEVHLMVENPKVVAREWTRDMRVDRLIFHIEAVKDPAQLIADVRGMGVEVAFAINPSTPIEELWPWVAMLDMVVVMGVEPGFSGQKLDPSTVKRVSAVRAHHPTIPIEVDGGVHGKNISKLARAGASRFVAASAIFKKRDKQQAIISLYKHANI